MFSFKAPKKRNQARVLSKSLINDSRSDEEDDSEHDRKRRRSKKRSRDKKALKKSSNPTSAGAVSFSMDDVDDENELSNILKDGKKIKQKKKKKKSKKRTGLGFGGLHAYAEEDYGSGTEITIGRGTMVSSFQHTDYENEGDEEEVGTSSLYGREAIEKLKSEQKAFIAKAEEAAEPSIDTVPREKVGPLGVTNNEPIKTSNLGTAGDDFIPLDSTKSPVIITGDDAIAYVNGRDDGDSHYDKHPRGKDSIDKAKLGADVLSNLSPDKEGNFARKLQSVSEGNITTEEDIDEGGRRWEEEIARRAGVGSSADGIRVNETSSVANRVIPTSDDNGNGAIAKIKTTIESTVDNLLLTSQDLESSIGRRQHEYEMSKSELAKHEGELSSTGSRFDYLSKLRMNLVNWVGALRQTQDSIKKVEDALLDFNRDLSAKDQGHLRDLEDDVVSLLLEETLLKTVIGRKPTTFEESSTSAPVVDEFGRDVRSLKSLGRSKRLRHRRKARQESRDRRSSLALQDSTIFQCYEDTDGELSDNELMDRGERRHALSDAVQVALDELEEEYISVSALISLFMDFAISYPEEYKQCYASLSLVDLMSILARAEFCRKLDFSRLMNGDGLCQDGSLHDFAWHNGLVNLDKKVCEKDDSNLKESSEDTSALSLLTQRLCFDVFSFALIGEKLGGESNFFVFDPFSEKQTKAMTTMFESIASNLSKKSRAKKEQLATNVLDYITGFLQHMAIPLVNHDALQILLDGSSHESDDRIDAVRYATVGQLYRLKKLILNISRYWGSVMEGSLNDKLAKFCLLDVIAYRFLPVLETVENDGDSKFTEETTLILKSVVNGIKEANWMNRSNLMLSSAPIRVVQSKYKIS
jgi:hypothetical protein